MERYKRFLFVAASLTLVLALVTVLGTKEAHALVASMVQIVNNTPNPIPTVRVDNPARQAVVLFSDIAIPDTKESGAGKFGDNNGDYTVPPGKRLVIESVSGSFHLPTGQKPLHFQVLPTFTAEADSSIRCRSS